MTRNPSLFLPLLLLLLLCPRVWTARAEGLADADTRLPIEVTANELVVDRSRRLAIFRGDVEARQGSLLLRADEVQVSYREDGAQDSQMIQRIEARGHVRLSSAIETANGESAVYDLDRGTVVMEGNVVLTRGDNVVQGERLVVDLRARTAVVEATRGRVRALFRPEELGPRRNGGTPQDGKGGGKKGGEGGPKDGAPAPSGPGTPKPRTALRPGPGFRSRAGGRARPGGFAMRARGAGGRA